MFLYSKHVLKVSFKPSSEFWFFFPSSNFAYLCENGHWSCFLFLFFLSLYKIWFYTTGNIRLWSNSIGNFGIWLISYCKIQLGTLLFEHSHFTKNQILCNWFGRLNSNNYKPKISFFYLKIQTYYSHFPSIFYRSYQIHCFLHTVDAIPKRMNH